MEKYDKHHDVRFRRVAPAQHAMAFLGSTTPLLYFGNDGGLWRSIDGVNQTGAACSTGDAAHFQNLNGGLGSLAEVTGMANSETDGNVVLAGFGTNGSAAMTSSGQTAWPQLLSGEGGLTAIDPTNPDNWYATVGPYVAIGQCIDGVNCTAATFPTAIGASETAGDQSLLFTPYILDPADSANMIVGTCRVWRGPASGGNAWSATNVLVQCSTEFRNRTATETHWCVRSRQVGRICNREQARNIAARR